MQETTRGREESGLTCTRRGRWSPQWPRGAGRSGHCALMASALQICSLPFHCSGRVTRAAPSQNSLLLLSRWVQPKVRVQEEGRSCVFLPPLCTGSSALPLEACPHQVLLPLCPHCGDTTSLFALSAKGWPLGFPWPSSLSITR